MIPHLNRRNPGPRGKYRPENVTHACDGATAPALMGRAGETRPPHTRRPIRTAVAPASLAGGHLFYLPHPS